jgi:Ca2+-binding RTX toxin-like protein
VVGAATETLFFQNSGLLSGSSHAYTATLQGDTTARDLITNTGRIVGAIDLGSGNDSYSGGSGHLAGHLLAGGGNDAIIGGVDNDWFEGGIGNDTLTGNAGNDRLIGDAGNDRLFGGAGIDKLTGGANTDVFVFNTALNAATNSDVVTDFVHGQDKFWLENAVLTKLGAGVHALSPLFFHAGAAAADANDYVVYNRATGVLSYDVNGNAAGGAIAFAVLTNHPVLAANDFLVI